MTATVQIQIRRIGSDGFPDDDTAMMASGPDFLQAAALAGSLMKSDALDWSPEDCGAAYDLTAVEGTA